MTPPSQPQPPTSVAFVLRSAQVRPDGETGALVGGKARALAQADRASLPVPPWFVVTTAAFSAARTGDASSIAEATAATTATDVEGLRALVATVPLSEEFRAALAEAVVALSPAGELLAVRSSASDEDGAAHSFAGQLESYLFVPPAEVEARVRDVWQSGLSDRLVEYRRHHGLPLPPRLPAVLVQRMVRPRTAGVAFAADPVSGRRGVAIVSAVLGVGTSLVSGEGDADTWQVDRSGTIVARAIADKRTKDERDDGGRENGPRNGEPRTGSGRVGVGVGDIGHSRDSDRAADGGVRSVPVADGEARAPALTDAQVLAVAALAREASRVAGRPQDIEWAIDADNDNATSAATATATADNDDDGGRLFLLQSRPITTLAHHADPDATLAIWDNSNIVESYSGVTTPLTFSFASEVYQGVYRQFCRLMGVSALVLADEDDTFRNMLGLIRGRLYYNLLNWYRVLALLPGFTMNRRFMEQMMGVRESLPEAITTAIVASVNGGTANAGGAAGVSAPPRRRARGKLRDAVALGGTIAGLLVNYVRLPRQIARFTARLDEALAPPAIPLSDQRPDELAGAYRDLRRKLLTRWDAPLVNDFFAMIFYGVLRQLTARWCGDTEGTLQNDLVGGEGGMVSAEPAQRLQAMARVAAAHPALAEQLRTGTIDGARNAIAAVPAFAALHDAYLQKFGERCVNELKLESATLHDDPLPLLRAAGHLAQYGSSSAEGQAHALRAQARERTRAALARRPLRRLLFSWVLRNARTRVRDRENLRLERTRLFGRVRRIVVELGRRLYALDRLDDPRDVFYLEIDELLAFVEGRATCTDLRSLARIRRAEFAAYAADASRDDQPDRQPDDQPDDRFETHGMPYQGHTFKRVPGSTADAGSATQTRTDDDTAAATGSSARRDGTSVSTGAGAGAAGVDARQGLGCCPGIVRGPVRVVRDPHAIALERRGILVAEHTDPGWIMIFPSATGLLVERGSLLSHAAIVARELGIPAIVSVPGVTRWLRDGDWVEMDGATGRVRRIPPEDPHAQ